MRKKQKKQRNIFLLGIVLFILSLGLFVVFGRYLPVLFELVFHKDIDLKQANRDTVNILLLGTGGQLHEGPDLTDTILFASIHPSKNTVTLVSIPRDLWMDDLQAKINTAYAVGNAKQKDGGKVLAKAAVSKVVGQQIDYVFRIDFDGFVKAVDAIGGLTIDVERGFDDYQYPDESKREDLCGQSLEEATARIATMEATVVFPCRYQQVHFDQGKQEMDGKQALIFVRSRYAIGPEGTDFARSMRQEKVIKAFREKVLSLGTFLNPTKVLELYGILQDSIDTDIEQKEFDDFIRLFQKMKDAKIRSVVLDYGDQTQEREGLLKNPPLSENYNGQWVLIPRKGNDNYSEIHDYVVCVMDGKECPVFEFNETN